MNLTSLFLGRTTVGNIKAKVEIIVDITNKQEKSYEPLNYPPQFISILNDKTFVIYEEEKQKLELSLSLPVVDDDDGEMEQIELSS